MSRPAATIVVPVWNAWEVTRACLSSLRPTLSGNDQVIVVDNGSSDGTAAGLRSESWIDVVTNPDNRGFPAACNQGAAGARGDIVVFLNNDTLVPEGWLEELGGAFSDPDVGAAGPVTNYVSGAQLVQVPYRQAGPAGLDAAEERQMRAFARRLRSENRGSYTEVEMLVGFCLAVRRSVFEDVGGFDEAFGIGGVEDNDLCGRIMDAGHRLVLARGCFVHHDGHRTFDANGVDWAAHEVANRAYFLDKLLAARLAAAASRRPGGRARDPSEVTVDFALGLAQGGVRDEALRFAARAAGLPAPSPVHRNVLRRAALVCVVAGDREAATRYLADPAADAASMTDEEVRRLWGGPEAS